MIILRFLILISALFFLNLPALAVKTAKSHAPEAFLKNLKNNPNAGKAIYQEFCSVCHALDPMIEVGAPKKNKPSDWCKRSQKIEVYLQKTIEGLNAMPPRGGCFECSDEQLEGAIRYMISDS